MPDWEYCRLSVVRKRNLSNTGVPALDLMQGGDPLAQLGREGWELVAVTGQPALLTGQIEEILYFKRPRAG